TTHTLHRKHHPHHTLQTTLAHHHTHHHTTHQPNPTNQPGQPSHHTKLPTYPFQHQPYWITSLPATRQQTESGHPLLGEPVELAAGEGRWFNGELEANRPWFLDQHRLAGTAVLPAAAMLEWAVEGVRAVGDVGPEVGVGLEGVTFNDFLHFGADVPVKVQASVVPEQAGYLVRCFGQPDEPATGKAARPWTEHLTVALAAPVAAGSHRVDLDDLRDRMPVVDSGGLYERLHRIGVEYGPAFRALKQLRRSAAGTEALALVAVEAPGMARDTETYTLHPVVLDACFQVVAGFTESDETLRLPVGLDRIRVYERLPHRVWAYARWHGVDESGECSMDLDLLTESGKVLASVEGLRFRTVAAASLRGMAVTRPREYAVEWVPFVPPVIADETVEPAQAPWLVVDRDDMTGGWRGRLVRWGASADGEGDGGAEDEGEVLSAPFVVDAETESELERFFGERLSRELDALGADSGRLAGLVLNGVSGNGASGAEVADTHADADTDTDTDGEFSEVQRLALHSLLILKHFLRARGAERPSVVIRSVGAAHLPPGAGGVAGSVPSLAQSVLTGATKAVISDHPDLRCVQVDIDPAGPVPPLGEAIARAALLPGAGHLAERGGRWFEARITEREPAGGRPPVDVRPDGTYLVTGGLGGIGLEVARWLARQGATSLVLAGRNIPERVPSEVARLRADGVRVELRRADVSRADDVAGLVSFVREELPALRGVFHLAGVVDDAVLDHLDGPRIRGVLGPKAGGAWHLHQACGEDLDLFVLFSSMTAITGAAGQSSYVLANTVLDALAARRERLGLPALSVGWGAWGEVGMAARGGSLAGLAATGVDAMPPRQAFDAFQRLSAGGPAHVGLARMDWDRYAAVTARPVPYTLLESVLPSGVNPWTTDGTYRSAEELTELAAADPEQARDIVLGELFDMVSVLLGLDEQRRDELRPGFGATRLNVLGLDSLTTVRLRGRLLSDTSADVPSDLLFGGGTAREIADFVCRQLALRSVLAADDDAVEDSAETEVLTL
ncbi:type I polyketide synthase, partial [Streptomyces sp. NPDC048436]|uniref:type I polyketide synthase n=1 Tax=Streptomyces sp. NPDC048436 TaxID=3365550 RepID=UPI003724AF7F